MWNFLKKLFGKNESQPVVSAPSTSSNLPETPATTPIPVVAEPAVVVAPVAESTPVPATTVVDTPANEKPKTKRKKKSAEPVATTPWPFEDPVAKPKKKPASKKNKKA